jgi:aminopeptidase N
MRWFNDVWMKEVFANFMAAKIVNPSFPEVNHDLRFLLSNHPAAYDVDRTKGANAIRQPLANLDEAGSLYGAIIYQKAPIVMRHLERLMGEQTFRDGVRAYLKKYAFSNATWTELINILDERTPADLATWSHVWVEEAGRPDITTGLDIRNGRIASLVFEQRDPAGKGRVWPQELHVILGYADRTVPLVVAIKSTSTSVAAANGLAEPLYVLPTGGGWAYGGFHLDRRSLDYLSQAIPQLPDALTRGAAWITLWDAMLEHDLPATAFVQLASAALPRETDEQLTQRVLGYVVSAWWRYLTTEEREARAADLEKLLTDGLASAATARQKSAWFGTLRDVALTPPTIGWLRRVWEQQEQVPGLPLAEPDYSTLAEQLAVREVEGWRGILDVQLARITNPDRKARFQFVMPALSANPAERERWFNALADVSNRRREPWVLDGLAYLHHPLRAAASARDVAPALDMLWEIQKTGDIFFPKRWMDATLSGHSEPAVAATVQRFLDTRPAGYPPRLRQIVLQSADELFRAAAMR